MISYNFNGIAKQEIQEYISSRLKLAGVTENIFNANATEGIYGCSNGSTRKLNNVLEKCLTIAYQKDKRVIDTEVVMEAQNEIELV